MNNIKAVIEKHNRKILSETNENENIRTCNCRNRQDCPLNGKCLQSNIIYQAIVSSEDGKTETYIGLTENQFKTRYNNHKSSFNNQSKRCSTELSNYIWKLKDQRIEYNIVWKVITKARAYNSSNNRCKLCTAEKYYIIFQPEKASLNDRRQIITTCRHSSKYLLCQK